MVDWCIYLHYYIWFDFYGKLVDKSLYHTSLNGTLFKGIKLDVNKYGDFEWFPSANMCLVWVGDVMMPIFLVLLLVETQWQELGFWNGGDSLTMFFFCRDMSVFLYSWTQDFVCLKLGEEMWNRTIRSLLIPIKQHGERNSKTAHPVKDEKTETTSVVCVRHGKMEKQVHKSDEKTGCMLSK